MATVVVVILLFGLCAAGLIISHLKEKRIHSLQWPKVGRARAARLIDKYLRSRGWKFDDNKTKTRYDAVITKDDMRLLVVCLENSIVAQKSVATIIDNMSSNTSFLRGLHKLGVIYVTYLSFSTTAEDVIYDHNLLHFHVSELALLRDIRDVQLENAALLDRRQLRLLTYSASMTRKLVGILRDRGD
jgi:hypothetical protein